MSDPSFTMPPLEWIRAFEAAARLGSFTAAAEETGLTQSAISQRIGHLEKRLGMPLFHRRARSITLTLEGEAWLPHVRTAMESLRASSEALFGPARGRLTISASLSMIDLWLVPRLARLRDVTRAQISLNTLVLGAHSMPEDEVIRIRYGAGDWPHAYKTKLYSERIAPAASPELVACMGGQPWQDWPRITLAGPRPSWSDWSAAFACPTTPVPELRFDTYQPAQSAAEGGAGVFLASLPLAQAALDTGRLVRLGDDILTHHATYWLIASRTAVTRAQWERLEQALR